MFQIAATLAVAKNVGEEVVFPHTTYAGHRGVRSVDLSLFGCYYPRGELPLGNTQYNEQNDEYSPIPESKNLTISGFFQSYKYFDSIRHDLINKWFVPNDAITERLSKMEISQNATGVSVRRGDYLMLQQNHCVLGEQYYNDAFEKYCGESDQLFVFSDDFEWCKQTFGGNVIYVQEDIGVQLFLMTKMKHLVLSNSTFAWWGAYLNNMGGNIVMPDPWYGPNYDGRGNGLVYPSWKVLKHERKQQPWGGMTKNMIE
jgi:hypothetical protein